MKISDIIPSDKIKKIAKEEILGAKPYKLKRDRYFNIGYRIFIGLIIFFLIFSSLTGFSFRALGEKELKEELYSSDCSGSWQNPKNAQGKPEVFPDGTINSFSEGNSATYKGGIGDLICKEFKEHETTQNGTQSDTKISVGSCGKNNDLCDFVSAKIYFSFAIDEKGVDKLLLERPNAENRSRHNWWRRLFSLIARAQENNAPATIPENLNGNNIDTKIVIWYSLNGETWYTLDKISSLPLSNALNGGYFNYEAPFLKSWDDVKNLKIKFEGMVGGETDIISFVDSVWVEVNYIETKKIESKPEPQPRVFENNFRANEEPEIEFKKIDLEKLGAKIKLLDYEGQEIKIPFEIEGSKIQLQKPRDFRPGLYKLKIEYEQNGKKTILEQEFTWGVLAINANKSIYLPGEKAYLQMAALRDDGHTICDANLLLRITNPNELRITELSTQDGTIQYSGECRANNVTDKPDYFAYYQVGKSGTYQMRLINLDNDYEITDSFEVRNSVPFDVERIGPTRIYPPAIYEMTLKIKANQDFRGEVVESVPENFEILECQNCLTENSSPPNSKELRWQVNWKAGGSYELRYQFDAPDVSPYLYLLGPLEFYSSPSTGSGRPDFFEIRSWQIAADADSWTESCNTPTGKCWKYFECTNTPYDDSCAGCSTGCPSRANTDRTSTCSTSVKSHTCRCDGKGCTGVGSATCTTPTGNCSYSCKTNYSNCDNNNSNGCECGTPADCCSGTGSNYIYDCSSAPICDGTSCATCPANCTQGTNCDNATHTQICSGGSCVACDTGYASCDVDSSNGCETNLNTDNNNCGSCGNVCGTGYECVNGVCTLLITVSGTIYTDEGTTAYDCSANNLTVSLRVNGAGTYSGTCTLATGAYSVSNVTINAAGDVVTVFLDGETEKAVTATRAADTTSDITGLDLYQNRLIVRHEDAGPITNTNLGQYDKDNDTDIHFTSNAGALTVDNDTELHIWTGKSFSPGGTVTTSAGGTNGDIHIDDNATFTAGGAISCGGSWTVDTGSTFTHNNNDVTFTATATGKTITTNAQNFYNLIFNGSGGGWTPQDAVAVSNDLTTTAGTLSGTQNITVSGGDITGTNGTINLTGGTTTLSGTGNLGPTGTGTYTFNGLTLSGTTTAVGDFTVSVTFTISSGYSFDASSYTITLSACASAPFYPTGTFTPSTSTFKYTCDNIGGGIVTANTTYYNLEVVPQVNSGLYLFGDAVGQTITTNNYLKIGDGVYTGVEADNTLYDVILDINGDLIISSGGILTASSTASFTVGGNWSNSGTFTHSSGTVTFDATTTGKTISDGGSAFYNITFNGSGGGWLYKDGCSTAPNQTTVQAGTATFLNAKTGTVSVTGGTLNVDWYLGVHVVDANNTSTNIDTGPSDITIFGFNTGANTPSWNMDCTGDCGTATCKDAGKTCTVFGDCAASAGACSGSANCPTAPSNSQNTGGTCSCSANAASCQNCILSILKGTEVLMSDGSYKKIEDIKKGEYVKSFNLETQRFVNSQVEGISNQKEKGYLIINYTLKVTKEHSIHLNRRFQKAGNVKTGDTLLNERGREVRVFSIKSFRDEIDTYHLSLDCENNFFVGGYLVHNSPGTCVSSAPCSVSGGPCSYKCNAGYSNCDGDNTNGCETYGDCPASTVWRHNGTDWGTAASSQTTGTDSTGKNPQPNNAGAIRIREYSMTASATCPGAGCTLYQYNLQIVWQTNYGEYDYYDDYGENYLTSCIAGTSWSCNDDSADDDAIGQNWHRATPGTMNSPYTCPEGSGDTCVNNAPTNGSWYIGMIVGLEFTIASLPGGIDFGTIDPGAAPTNQTDTITVSTSASNGYIIYAWSTQVMTCDDAGQCGTETISDWSGTNSNPTNWETGAGFGYKTNDNNLTGGTADRFTNDSFCGASGGNGCWAGFVHTGPGDPVADRSGPTKTADGSNIITYRIAASTIRRPGPYKTTTVFVVVAQY